MKKQIKGIQIFRHVVQLVLFFLLPGLYIMVFNEFKDIYQMILSGNFNFIQAFPSIMELIAVFTLTIVLGRFFCGWMCAFGTFNDLIYELSKRVFKLNYKVNEKLDSTLKKLKYIVFLSLVIFVWTNGSSFLKGASPWDAFAQITDFPQVFLDFTIGSILLIMITIGSAFVERFFCRYLCPLGAMFSILSRINLFKISKPKDKCGSCRACTNKCSMGLQLYKIDDVKGGECINCLKCAGVCPRRNANANIAGENINPVLAGAVAIAVFASLYILNSAGGTLLTEAGYASTKAAVIQEVNSSSSEYKDGTYTGSGTGFRGATTTVSVTICNGEITNIETVSSGDTPRFYNRVVNMMFDRIISSQSTSVDTVSGVTYSSNGIIEAVEDALRKAI